MSFEIKYDKDGVVVPGTPPSDEPVSVQQESAAEVHESGSEQSVEGADPIPEPTTKRSDVKESWSVLRDRIEKSERRSADLEKALAEAQSKNNNAQEDDDTGLPVDEDALVEQRHLSKVDKKIKKLEQQLKQYEQQSATSATEARLKKQYPDFDSVVSSESLANLSATYPELAHTLNSTGDLYNKAVAAYTMIKRLGLAEQEDAYQNEKALAQKNASKPKSLASISPQQGDSPLSKANAFANGTIDDDMKKQLWKEMNDLRRNF